MIQFDDAHKAVHYPPDRHFGIWIRPSIAQALAINRLAGLAYPFWSAPAQIMSEGCRD
jgi:hypothetical protein